MRGSVRVCKSVQDARVRVKICGVTTPEDALLAVAAGADAVGINFHPPSPRCVSAAQAARIAAALPALVAAVGVFANPERSRVERVLAEARLDCVQFHGDESPAFCASFGVPYIKAAGLRPGFDFEDFAARFADARALLLDACDPRIPGGTGRTFDWRLWPRTTRPAILAGGLHCGNVAAAIAATRPFAVDVASGVESVGAAAADAESAESAESGMARRRKDPERLRRFMEAVASA